MSFWIITGLLALIAGAFLALAVLRGRAEAQDGFDLQVYRDQLAEVDRDAERGVLAPEEAERVRTEVARRILAADRAAQDAPTTEQGRASPILAALLIVLVGGGAFGIYLAYGAPGYGDLPLEARIAAIEVQKADRPTQAELEAVVRPRPPAEPPSPDLVAQVERLRTLMADRPNDLQGHILLASY